MLNHDEFEMNDQTQNGMLYHQRRVLDDGQLIFVVNSHQTKKAVADVSVQGKYVVKLDLVTGNEFSYPGNAEMGGVSALMSIGLFSLKGSTDMNPIYEITSPVFDEVKIKLDQNYYSGKTFIIKTNNNSEENCYIQKAELNGIQLNQCWFTHEEFSKGGILELWMGDKPNKNWGTIK